MTIVDPEQGVLTYEKCKLLLGKARKPEKGKPLSHIGRGLRLFRESNGDFTVGFSGIGFSGGYGYGRTRRVIGRRGHAFYDVCRIRPNDSFTFFVDGPSRSTIVAFFLNHFTPLANVPGHAYLGVIAPGVGPKPRLRKVPTKIQQPFFVLPGEEGRDAYERHVNEHGSLEAWYEAYFRRNRIIEANAERLKKWVKGNVIRLQYGFVVDQEGYVSERSLKRAEAAERRLKREEAERRAQQEARYAETMEQAEERRRKEREEREAKLAERAEVARAWLAEVSDDGVEISNEVACFLHQHKLIPNGDGTATMVKALTPVTKDAGVTSRHDLTPYTIGERVEAPDFHPDPDCGRGLHFSPTFEMARQWADHRRATAMLCKVDLATMVVISNRPELDNYGTKVKAEWCIPLGWGDESVIREAVEDVEQDKTMTVAERIADRMAKASLAAATNRDEGGSA